MSGESFFDFKARITAPKRSVPAEGKPAQTPLTVTQITRQIDGAMKACFPYSVTVRGELSNVNINRASGHIYFTLKDDGACLDGVMFKSDASRLKFRPDNGAEMIATGSIKVYAQRGRYQLYATSLQPLGKGALELAFQQLKQKLEGEGLFAGERKKVLPRYPRHLVLVTSRQTAAMQDILKVIQRCPWLRVSVYHVPVQGDGSAERIAAALAHINDSIQQTAVDLILLARGGGSLEDLWEFNEELVARAIAASRIPIISGIGHETDVTIADLVADYHAHTPTEAAQVAVQHWKSSGEFITVTESRLSRAMSVRLQGSRQRLTSIERHEVFRRPTDRINSLRQLLDDRQRQILLASSEQLRRATESVTRASARLERVHPRHRVSLYGQRLIGSGTRLRHAIQSIFQRAALRIDGLQRHLHAIGPEQVLRRGYSITTVKKTKQIVRSIEDVHPGERILTRLADGEIESTVEDGKQLGLFE